MAGLVRIYKHYFCMWNFQDCFYVWNLNAQALNSKKITHKYIRWRQNVAAYSRNYTPLWSLNSIYRWWRTNITSYIESPRPISNSNLKQKNPSLSNVIWHFSTIIIGIMLLNNTNTQYLSYVLTIKYLRYISKF